MESDTMIEILKILIACIAGYLIIGALLSTGDTETVKNTCQCLCDQVNNSIIVLR